MSALPEARESLTYWESRLQTLPRRAVHKRREAREMAARWRARVSEAERAQYGAGVLGALLLVVAEGRLPVSARHTTRSAVRVGVRVAVGVAVFLTLLVVLLVALLVALIF
jgi:hypothetical protein